MKFRVEGFCRKLLICLSILIGIQSIGAAEIIKDSELCAAENSQEKLPSAGKVIVISFKTLVFSIIIFGSLVGCTIGIGGCLLAGSADCRRVAGQHALSFAAREISPALRGIQPIIDQLPEVEATDMALAVLPISYGVLEAFVGLRAVLPYIIIPLLLVLLVRRFTRSSEN